MSNVEKVGAEEVGAPFGVISGTLLHSPPILICVVVDQLECRAVLCVDRCGVCLLETWFPPRFLLPVVTIPALWVGLG